MQSLRIGSAETFVPLKQQRAPFAMPPGTLTEAERKEEQKLHWRTFMQNLRQWSFQTGAMAPTCDKVCDEIIDMVPGKVERYADIGTGTGPFLRAMLRQNKYDIATAVEPYLPFGTFTANTIRDDRVQVFEAYGEDLPALTRQVHGDKKLQLVTMSTPMVPLPRKRRVELMKSVVDSVEDGGMIILAIFNEIHGLFEEVCNQSPTVRVVRGQRRPPWPYIVQSIRKNRAMS